jgi:hypothetical protein
LHAAQSVATDTRPSALARQLASCWSNARECTAQSDPIPGNRGFLLLLKPTIASAVFSEGPDRVFARSRAILGRKVQHCHPPSSVGIVEQILSNFRAGRQNVAEFWIQLHGRFVHIRYFAVRDESRTYLGTLEVTQDLTPLRALQGEQRLLEYTGGPKGSQE